MRIFVDVVLICVTVCFIPSILMAQVPGDANSDEIVDIADVIYDLNYVFKEGPPPDPFECGDANADCTIDISDAIYLINYLFKEGSIPEMVSCEWSEPVNLGEPINSPRGEESFRMTPDGKMAVFSSNREGTHGNHDIWYSFWDSISGCWLEPINCGPNVNTVIEDLGPCLSPDGKKLYYVQFYRPGGYGGWDIWVSTWDSVNGEWGIPENLGPTINTAGSEWGPFVSPNGSKLYFSDSWGIWVSEWSGSEWQAPVLLDSTVNAFLDEKHPTVTANDSVIYFTRIWHTYCIWVSRWTGTGWGPAELLPEQINDSGGAGQSYITPDGSRLYFTSARPGGVGSGDIWVSERIAIQGEKRFINR
jgi:Tol biopolymer transport system component